MTQIGPLCLSHQNAVEQLGEAITLFSEPAMGHGSDRVILSYDDGDRMVFIRGEKRYELAKSRLPEKFGKDDKDLFLGLVREIKKALQ